MAHDEHSRRDEAGVGPYARGESRLVPLGTLSGWDVVDEDPDIRGWEVRTLSGRVVGEVKDLLVDRDHGEVVMIEVDVKGSSSHTLAPIRAAQVDRVERIVRIDSADLAEEAMPDVARRDLAEDEVSEAARRERLEETRRTEAHVSDREARLAEEREADRDVRRAREQVSDRGARIRVSERGVEERVIEQRPVVVEETVVRRRILGDESSTDPASRKAAEDRRDRTDEAR